MKRIKIERRYILAFAVSVLVITALIMASFYALYHQARENMIATRENEVLQAAAEASYFMMESVDAVKKAAYTIDNMQSRGAAPDEILDYLTSESVVYTNAIDGNFSGLYGSFDGVYLDGIGWEPDADYVAEERPWYTTAAEAHGNVALVTPYLDSQTGSVMMSISQMLSDGKSVVSLDISLNGIQDLTENSMAHHIWKCAMILDGDGFVVAHSDRDEVGKEYREERGSLGNAILEKLDSAKGNHFSITYKGDTYMVFRADVGSGWDALAVVDESRILGSTQIFYIIFFVTLVLIFGAIALFFWKLQQKQTQMEQLNRQIRSMANIYDAVRLINLEEDTYTMVSGGSEMVQVEFLLGEKQEHAQNALRATMDVMTDARFKKSMFEFITFATLQERLAGKLTIVKEYIDSPNRRCRARFVPVEWTAAGDLKVVMWMVEIIEELGN